MIKRIQIIGLPCSGKTTLIQQYIYQNPHIKHIDLNLYEGLNRESHCRQAIKKTKAPTLIESACGLYIPNVKVVRLKTNLTLLYERAVKRDQHLDEDYMSLLASQMIPAEYTVENAVAFNGLLDKLFN